MLINQSYYYYRYTLLAEDAYSYTPETGTIAQTRSVVSAPITTDLTTAWKAQDILRANM